MSIRGPIPVQHAFVFPAGAYLSGEVSAVLDFEASTKDRPVQSRDKVTGEPLWAVAVTNGSADVKAADKTVSVKIVSAVAPEVPPVPPAMAALGLPFIPVEFVDLTVTPYVNSANSRLAYSFRARGFRAAGVGKSEVSKT
ncbi:plasmid replication, integration and excision activator [Acrocarpospora sp. B8E8]|uniref:plasmid replication, integration and excision activator n=1 Tax=Acrocarpospora sp. B8E8 TaxID=3153572 RepID=UPI00325F3A02